MEATTQPACVLTFEYSDDCELCVKEIGSAEPVTEYSTTRAFERVLAPELLQSGISPP